jgi:hypothetical protein
VEEGLALDVEIQMVAEAGQAGEEELEALALHELGPARGRRAEAAGEVAGRADLEEELVEHPDLVAWQALGA